MFTSVTRADMAYIKLSLHRSGRWRMAWTSEGAAAVGLSAGADRVLTRWERPDDVRPGWCHAVTVIIGCDSLGILRPEKRLGRFALFPPYNPGEAMWFRVLLGSPGLELAVRGAIDVGTIELPGGAMVGVCARPSPLPSKTATALSDMRAHMLRAVTAAGARGNQGFGWGHLDDGAVGLLDSGRLETEGFGPAGGSNARPSG
ncbi:hypothetical protein GCM10009609_36270 [Pseudonocardia aurantiaca]|uniref:Uncharacterized protein n=1 Tax=Pseudonocardia aurantiaca TaxID=75290 RepID=A0ABW4FXD7_9PSEU